MFYLVLLLVACFTASATISGAWWDIPASELLTQGASFAPAVAAGESWRLLSAMLLHGGLLHLVFNSIALLEIGRPVERQLGRVAALSTFVLAGVCGFLASLWWQPEGISVGASGGIFGLLGCWALLAWRAGQGETAEPSRSRRQIVIGVLLLAVGSGFLIPNVDHAAHFGGLLAGVLSGALLAAGIRSRRRQWHSAVFFANLGLIGAALLITPQRLPEAWRIEYREMRAYAETYLAFAEEDRAINDQLQTIGESTRRNEMSDAEGVALLDGSVLPRLARQVDRMRGAGWQTPRIANDAAVWVDYATLRLDAVRALRRAVDTDDPAVARRELLRFESLMTEAARLAHPEAAEAQARSSATGKAERL